MPTFLKAADLEKLGVTYGEKLPPRDEVYGQLDPADVEALYARIRARPGAQDRHGVCVAHHRAIERFETIFRSMGWAA